MINLLKKLLICSILLSLTNCCPEPTIEYIPVAVHPKISDCGGFPRIPDLKPFVKNLNGKKIHYAHPVNVRINAYNYKRVNTFFARCRAYAKCIKKQIDFINNNDTNSTLRED